MILFGTLSFYTGLLLLLYTTSMTFHVKTFFTCNQICICIYNELYTYRIPEVLLNLRPHSRFEPSIAVSVTKVGPGLLSILRFFCDKSICCIPKVINRFKIIFFHFIIFKLSAFIDNYVLVLTLFFC